MEYRYIGESLAALADAAVKEATDRCARRIAQQGQSTMHHAAREATPSRTGAVRESWIAHEIRHDAGVYEARIENDHWLAHLLQYGTEAHEIKPKHRRAISEAIGPRGGAHVRGITPAWMTEKAALETEATIQESTLSIREEWAKEVESAIETAKRRLQR